MFGFPKKNESFSGNEHRHCRSFSLPPVSYTHLDVYKRQEHGWHGFVKTPIRNCWKQIQMQYVRYTSSAVKYRFPAVLKKPVSAYRLPRLRISRQLYPHLKKLLQRKDFRKPGTMSSGWLSSPVDVYKRQMMHRIIVSFSKHWLLRKKVFIWM